MKAAVAQTPKRQHGAGILVALLACLWTGFGRTQTMAEIPSTALSAASFYVLLVFYLKITGAIQFRREPQVHLGQAALLLFTLAAVAWAKVLLGGASSLLFSTLEYLPLAVLLVLLSGSWKGLLPLLARNDQSSQCSSKRRTVNE